MEWKRVDLEGVQMRAIRGISVAEQGYLIPISQHLLGVEICGKLSPTALGVPKLAHDQYLGQLPFLSLLYRASHSKAIWAFCWTLHGAILQL